MFIVIKGLVGAQVWSRSPPEKSVELKDMEVAMQRNSSSAMADRSFSLVRGPSDLSDPLAIYRRLDRRPRPRPMWMTAVAVAVLAVVAAGGAIAFQDELRPVASHTQFLTPGSVSHS
jgi:hypothetical protein